MKKEILLLSSLISLSIVLYLGIPGNENMDHKNIVEDEILESEVNNLPDDKLNKDPILKFDIVRLDPKGNIIIAGKTIPDAEIQIFDGNEKLSTVISDSHGDWVWVSENQIEDSHTERWDVESEVEVLARENQELEYDNEEEEEGVGCIGEVEPEPDPLDDNLRGRALKFEDKNSELKLYMRQIGKCNSLESCRGAGISTLQVEGMLREEFRRSNLDSFDGIGNELEDKT